MLALSLALEQLAALDLSRIRRVWLLSDSLTSCRLLAQRWLPRTGALQLSLWSILDKIHTTLTHNKTLRIILSKVQAHAGIPGNEKADKLAKKAMMRAKLHPQHTFSASYCSLKAALKQHERDQWRDLYRNHSSDPAKPFFHTFRALVRRPTSKFVEMFDQLSRTEVHIITRCLTDRLPLRTFEVHVGVGSDAHCTACKVAETTNHFLFTCRRFRNPRTALRNATSSTRATCSFIFSHTTNRQPQSN